MDPSQPGSQEKEHQREYSEPDDQRDCGPREKQDRRGVVVSFVGEGPPVPLVPLVAESAIYVNVNELCARTLGHRDEDS
jgi:hypothetical protein